MHDILSFLACINTFSEVTNNLSHGANDDTVAPSSGGFVEPMATAIKDYTAPSSDEISFKVICHGSQPEPLGSLKDEFEIPGR